MTAKTPLTNPRLVSKVAASQKAGVGEATPTHIAAILNRIGKLERAQRAAVPDQLLKRLDALGKIVANLEQAHGDLAAYLHQELVEIREALLDGSAADSYRTLVAAYSASVANAKGWPIGNHGEEIDVDALAQEVHDLRPNAVIPIEDRGQFGKRTPSWLQRWLSRHIFR